MMKREHWWKIAISSVLVLTLVATGVALYTIRQEQEKNKKQNTQLVDESDLESQDVSNDSVTAKDYEQKENGEKTEQEDKSVDADGKEDDKQISSEVSMLLDFHEDSVLLWPVNGKVLIDYSMETTTYFPTLDQY